MADTGKTVSVVLEAEDIVGSRVPGFQGRITPAQGFVEGAGEAGVVYVSLGTVCSVGEAELRELARALSGLPCRVIWKVGAPARDHLPYIKPYQYPNPVSQP